MWGVLKKNGKRRRWYSRLRVKLGPSLDIFNYEF